MVHQMKLAPIPFEKIASGSKTIELRLNDEKRRKIQIGDKIVFTHSETGDIVTALVIALHQFPSFKELYETLPLTKCGYSEREVPTANYTDMYNYYTPQQESLYGALGIEITLK